jgi:hypothetical protein
MLEISFVRAYVWAGRFFLGCSEPFVLYPQRVTLIGSLLLSPSLEFPKEGYSGEVKGY